jgi:UDP-GlcNAc3NAcA epimerase
MKLVTVIGARPQFIKAAAVSRRISSAGTIREVIVHTGQHFDANMSDVFFSELDIPAPAYHLGIGGGNHGAMTGRQLEKIEEVLIAEKPDWVLVYGDTNSTLAGALAAAKLHIKVAHVEAGLRSFNRRMPEEVNRVLTDHVATILFAPTQTAIQNLSNEGIRSGVHLCGDVMYDAAMFFKNRAQEPRWFKTLGLSLGGFVLATIHRAENTDDAGRLSSILSGLARAGLPVVLPLHPRTRARLTAGGNKVPANIHIVEPVGFLEMVWLEVACRMVATDSGGVQKEAYFHGKPCVTLRDETEWVELVETGWNVLAGADAEKIAKLISSAKPPAMRTELYGDGDAASRIVRVLSDAA